LTAASLESNNRPKSAPSATAEAIICAFAILYASSSEPQQMRSYGRAFQPVRLFTFKMKRVGPKALWSSAA